MSKALRAEPLLSCASQYYLNSLLVLYHSDLCALGPVPCPGVINFHDKFPGIIPHSPLVLGTVGQMSWLSPSQLPQVLTGSKGFILRSHWRDVETPSSWEF